MTGSEHFRGVFPEAPRALGRFTNLRFAGCTTKSRGPTERVRATFLVPDAWHLAPDTYSYLSATKGSTLVARRAGR